MHELYELKEMLMKELEEYGRKGELTAGSLEIVDKLTHTIKNLCKIIEESEESEGYSSRYYPMYGSYNDGGSYRRGGRSYAQRRDSMGRYSGDGYYRDGGMVEELRELMEDAPDERTRQEFQRFIDKIERM